MLFDGVVGKYLPKGLTKEQSIALLRLHGEESDRGHGGRP